jgi:hypothetical protein
MTDSSCSRCSRAVLRSSSYTQQRLRPRNDQGPMVVLAGPRLNAREPTRSRQPVRPQACLSRYLGVPQPAQVPIGHCGGALGPSPGGREPSPQRQPPVRNEGTLVGAENLIRPCEQDEWIEAMEWVNSILAMSGDVVAAQTHDPTLGRTR